MTAIEGLRVKMAAVQYGIRHSLSDQDNCGATGKSRALVVGQAHDQGLDRVAEVLGRDPLPRADQRVPGAFRT
jgi:hypothetical protein